MRGYLAAASCLVLLSVSFTGTTGCHPLDRIARSIEAYGTVSVSAPLLVEVERAKGFKFDLDKPATFYYDASRIEGAVRLVTQESFDLQVALRVQIDQLLGSLAKLKAAKSGAETETVGQELTKQALSLAALNSLAGGQSAAAMAANPALAAGLALLSGTNLATAPTAEVPAQTSETPPDAVPDEAAPDKTMDEVVEEAGPQDGGAAEAEADESEDAGDESGEFKSLLPLDRPAQKVLTSEKFSPLPERYSGKLTISPRQAIMLAANDKMTQDLFKWFASPYGYGRNKTAYFCMLTVSCHPGYKTRQNFMADVMVTTEFAKEAITAKVAGTSRDGGWVYSSQEGHEVSGDLTVSDSFARPFVTAVYPMVDSQVLSLRYGLRQQVARAMQLAMLGFGAQAELLADHVKRVEQDAETVTATTVGSAYSAGGYNFGFRIEPRFVALSDAASAKTTPGYRLESIEFPAMVLVFVDHAEKRDYTHVAFNIESRWLPRDGWTAFWSRLSEAKIHERARDLDDVKGAVTSGTMGSRPLGELERMTLLRRRWTMAAAGLGSTILMELPRYPTPSKPPDTVTVTAASYSGWKNALSAFVVAGQGFTGNVEGAAVGGRSCPVKVVSDTTVVVTCDAWGDQTTPDTGDLVLITKKGPRPAGTVTFDRTYKQTTATARPSVTIERDAEGRITGVKVTGDFGSAEKLLQAIQEALKCCGNVDLQIDASGSVGLKAGVKAGGGP